MKANRLHRLLLLSFLLGMPPVLQANTNSNTLNDELPQLKEFIGQGQLRTKTSDEDTVADAALNYINDIVIDTETKCGGVLLKHNAESIFAIVHCESGRYFLCPGGIKHCNKEHFSATQLSKHSFHMTGFDDENNYRIEYADNQLVYRIQEKSCLIPYPHGCLVHGFSWEDKYVYSFNKTSTIK